MTIVALDISKRRTGWALWRPGLARAGFSSWVLGSEFTSDGGTCAKLHANLMELHSVEPFEYLFIEKPLTQEQRGGNSSPDSDILLKLVGHAESFAAAYSLRTVQAIDVNSWRGDFLGRELVSQIRADVRRQKKAGNTKASGRKDLKWATMERCRQLGFAPRYDDEADAIGLLTYAILLRGETPPWLAAETLKPLLAVGGAR